jgi:hypothetical protein
MTGCLSPEVRSVLRCPQPSGCALLDIGFYESQIIVRGRDCFFGFSVGDQRYVVKRRRCVFFAYGRTERKFQRRRLACAAVRIQ